MKPAARIQTTIDLLALIEAARIPMDNTMRDFMAAHRFIGSKDRAAIVERVYRIIRAQARLQWWIAQQGFAGDVSPARLRVIADLVLSEAATLTDIEGLFDGEQYSPAPLTDEERAFAGALQGASLDSPSMPDQVRGECPPWAEPLLRPLFGEQFEAHLRAMINLAPLDLRVNTLKGTIEEALDSLRQDNINAQPTEFSPLGLRVAGKPFITDTEAFRSGLIEIQDEGSQLIGLACGARPGMRVLDYCAGGGGKTLVLAAMMQNKGNIVATDTDARRLDRGRPRYKKAGVHNVELRSLAEEQNRKWLRRQKGTMDIVLVDAPCSSSGTWRRNPDLRWNWYGPPLDEILAMQAEILERVADKVKPGGRLVYATCSLFHEENEGQVERFLSNHPEYEIKPISSLRDDFAIKLPCPDPYMRLQPLIHGTDGFFAAVLQRKHG